MGGAVGEVARLLGKPFMPWQQYVADVICELDPDTGEFVYSEWGLTVPRQSGKSTFVLAKNTHRASATKFFGPDQNMIYTAQTRKDARLKFEEDYVKVYRASRYFKTRADYRAGNGNEHVRFPNGSRWAIEANTEKAGHGGSLHEADIDEAFAQVDFRLEQAFEPAMITLRNTRLGWLSTAGWVDGSPYLQVKTKAGREAVALGQRRGLAYFEWSAPEDADPGDLDVWRGCMPALGLTVPLAAIQRRYDKAVAEGNLNGFRRAYLNQWVPKSSDEPPTISETMWAAQRDDFSSLTGRPSLALDVTMDRQVAYIAAAGDRADGLGHLQVLAQLPGSEHVVAEIEALRSRREITTVVLDPSSAAGALIPELQRAGIPVELVTATEVAQACGALYDGLVQSRFRYVEHEALSKAVGNAILRASTRGASRWFPIGDGPSVSPLYAVTLAAHGHAKHGNQTSSGGWAVAL